MIVPDSNWAKLIFPYECSAGIGSGSDSEAGDAWARLPHTKAHLQ